MENVSILTPFAMIALISLVIAVAGFPLVAAGVGLTDAIGIAVMVIFWG